MSEADLKLRGLVHDLNNVFQTILDAAELVPEGSRWKRMATTIANSAEHGLRLTRELLESHNDSFDFSAIVESAVQFTRDVLLVTSGPPIEFHTEVPTGLRMRGTAVGWERVLVNLFLNSAQVMKQGGAIHLRVTPLKGNLQILVWDNGPGIPEPILARIFEPHFSTKAEIEGRRKNLGLGLHIVKSIVEAHGGAVTARNRPDGGAEFEILVKMVS
ncbi:MAG: HAMP domain-containing histidine kinase [Bryobacteraceae bacterium]|nr:HAMP domain-containing histidine kinase [Bryobacteraceae bacterium]MDW8379471.1 HAMP domain-containing sensor histidine kinase [Bryobacterales bacterium]